MNKELEKLMIDYVEIRMEKYIYIRSQRYTDAVDARNIERNLDRKILDILLIKYDNLTGNELDIIMDNSLTEYFFKNYNIKYKFDSNQSNDLKTLIREFKLKKLGI